MVDEPQDIYQIPLELSIAFFHWLTNHLNINQKVMEARYNITDSKTLNSCLISYLNYFTVIVSDYN